MSASGNHPVHQLLAITARFLTPLSTLVVVGADGSATRFLALVVLVFAVVRVTDPFAGVTALQPEPAGTQTPSLRGLLEVPGAADLNPGLIRMILTAQSQRISKTSNQNQNKIHCT